MLDCHVKHHCEILKRCIQIARCKHKYIIHILCYYILCYYRDITSLWHHIHMCSSVLKHATIIIATCYHINYDIIMTLHASWRHMHCAVKSSHKIRHHKHYVIYKHYVIIMWRHVPYDNLCIETMHLTTNYIHHYTTSITQQTQSWRHIHYDIIKLSFLILTVITDLYCVSWSDSPKPPSSRMGLIFSNS